MVSIRNGTPLTRKRPSPSSSSSSSSWMLHLPQIIGVFLIATISFYGGIWVGMRMTGSEAMPSSSSSSLRADTHREAAATEEFGREEFEKRVEAEVTKRSAAAANSPVDGDIGQNNNDNNDIDKLYSDKSKQPRRFPSSIKSFATGAAIVSKRDFLTRFDYGIPMPPSKREGESDPGKDDVLLLYGSDRALPDDHPTSPVYHDHRHAAAADGSPLPHLSAAAATANCSGLNVIFTDNHGDVHQCTAIVGNYESYHIQRWLRMNPSKGYSKLDPHLPLHPVGRGLQTNGQDKFSAPEDKYALQNQELLIAYFERLEGTLAELRPLARECAGGDNTVVVMVCNTGQSDLLINFICSAEARGFGDVVREKVLVFATDQGVYDIATGLGLRAFYDEKIFEQMPEKEAGMYGDKSFTAMMWSKVVTVQLVNRLGHDVLFQDVDLVWYKNPLEFFHDKTNPLHDFDILFQDDGARSLRYAPYSANTGFYYVRNNDKTKFLFRSLLYLGDMVLSMTSHQQALGALLDEHSSLTGLRVKTLSGLDFPGGYHYHRKKEIEPMRDIVEGRHVPYIFHMSWTTNKKNKLLFLKQMGLWYTNTLCENGGGVGAAKISKEESTMESSCCSAEPLVSCHYSDKPSVKECKDSPKARSIDAKGKPFWK